MDLEYDEERWPGLSAFRKACLRSDVATMKDLAARGHEWYENENPSARSAAKLSDIFKVQHFASEGDLPCLTEMIEANPGLVNEPWTAQRWRPLSQAVQAGHSHVVEYLLAKGADPFAMIGDVEEEISIVDFAHGEFCHNAAIQRLIRNEPNVPTEGGTYER